MNWIVHQRQNYSSSEKFKDNPTRSKISDTITRLDFSRHITSLFFSKDVRWLCIFSHHWANCLVITLLRPVIPKTRLSIYKRGLFQF